MQAGMLLPAVVLVLWSLVMLGWTVVARMPALSAAGINLAKAQPGGRGQDLDRVLPPPVMWKSHNYSHLMEQPTLFYATVAALAIVGPALGDIRLAWAYTALRIVHSLWQATVNRIFPVRFGLFGLSSAALVALAVRALLAILAQHPVV